MRELSVLIGGKAGFGIDKASVVLARLMGQLGYRVFVYRDYPSLIRGGHTFSIIRASGEKVAAHKDMVDIILALNQDTVDIHKGRLKEGGLIIFDADTVKPGSVPPGIRSSAIPSGNILKEEAAGEIMRNACMIGAFCRTCGMDWTLVEGVFRNNFGEDAQANLSVARRGHDAAEAYSALTGIPGEKLPVITGNEAVSLGLLGAGLDAYISYPMTPTSPILHFMAAVSGEFAVKTIHPEGEIAVMLMAAGMTACGSKVAVGTSGGGFCLMTEGLSFAGMAELPVVVILGQRPGPSTGLPTYSCQTELDFAMSAGQGEFARFVAAPGDPEEAYHISQLALRLSWKYQVPSIILTDKTLGKSLYSFDRDGVTHIKDLEEEMWDRQGAYKRYLITDTGVSPLAFMPDADAVIKVNSYEHDEYGVSTEEAAVTVAMQDKRLRKEKHMAIELESCECVRIHGNRNSKKALLSWGSNKGVSIEAAEKFGLRVVQVVTLRPFPHKQLAAALEGVDRIIAVESNATGQLARLVESFGHKVYRSILKYDGRPFGVEELEERLDKVVS